MEFTTCNTGFNVGTYDTEDGNILVMYTDMGLDEVRLLKLNTMLEKLAESSMDDTTEIGGLTEVWLNSVEEGVMTYGDLKYGHVSILSGHTSLKALETYFDQYAIANEDPLDDMIRKDEIKKAYIMSGNIFTKICMYFRNIGQHRPTLLDLLKGSDVRLFNDEGEYICNIYVP